MIRSDDKNKRTIDVVGIIIYVIVAVIITTVIVMTLQSVFGSTIAELDDTTNTNTNTNINPNSQNRIIWPPEQSITDFNTWTIPSIQTLENDNSLLQSLLVNFNPYTGFDDNDQQLTITIRPQQMIEEHEELVNDE